MNHGCSTNDPETKQQSEEWQTKSSPHPKNARMSRSRVKTMITVFFNSHGIVHKEFVPQGQIVNHAFYTEVLGNDFENGSSESEGTLQTIGFCNMITRQLTLRLQFENFW